MTIDEVAPRSSIEWLWTIDLIELSWDVVRYRSFGQKVPDVHREAAVTRPRLNDRVAASKAEPAAHKRKAALRRPPVVIYLPTPCEPQLCKP